MADFAAPELPISPIAKTIERPRFERWKSSVSAADWSRLKAIAGRLGVTPSGLLLTAFAETIKTFTGSSHFTINVTLFNREPIHPEVNEIVGDFTSMTLLDFNAQVPLTFENRARRLQKQLWEDLEHNQVSGVELLRELNRMRGRRVVFPVVFTSTLGLPALNEMPRGNPPVVKTIYGISQTPQVVLDHQVAERNGELNCIWDVLGAAFPPGFVSDMFQSYCGLLAKLVSAHGCSTLYTESVKQQ